MYCNSFVTCSPRDVLAVYMMSEKIPDIYALYDFIKKFDRLSKTLSNAQVI